MCALVSTQQLGAPPEGTSPPHPVLIDPGHVGGIVPFMGPIEI